MPQQYPLFMHCKRCLLSIMVGGITTCMAGAGPVLSVDTLSMRPGQTTNLILRLSSGTEGYAGFNAVLLVPAVVSIQDVVPGPLIPTNTFSFYYTVTANRNGAELALAATSVSNVMASAGILCTATVSAASDLLPGTYPLLFSSTDRSVGVNSRHALSNSNGLQSATHTYSDGTLNLAFAPSSGDSNGNGIPDLWEIRYFGTSTNINATTDADQDGLTDYYEYLARTNPTNAASFLAVAAASTFPVANRAMILRWYSISGTFYNVECSSNLVGWITIESDIPATPPLNAYPVVYTNSSGANFYRLKSK